MTNAIMVTWPTCREARCVGVRLDTGTCLTHADDQARRIALEQIARTGKVDARGVTISPGLLTGILAAVRGGKPGHRALTGADFRQATFTGRVRFADVSFKGDAWFGGATFTGDARFDGATFTGETGFDEVTFTGDARFDGATFQSSTGFYAATFKGDAWFGGATFTDSTGFDGVTFQRSAGFDRVTFKGSTWFRKATFTGEAGFGGATFKSDTWFGGATFTGDARFDEAVTDRALLRACACISSALAVLVQFPGSANGWVTASSSRSPVRTLTGSWTGCSVRAASAAASPALDCRPGACSSRLSRFSARATTRSKTGS